MKRIYSWEPWFFIFFGLFHMHRIWAIIDRETYASFWMGIMENKGLPYYLIMGILAGLCILGIITFIRERKLIICGVGYIFLVVLMFCLIYLQLQLVLKDGKRFWQSYLIPIRRIGTLYGDSLYCLVQQYLHLESV